MHQHVGDIAKRFYAPSDRPQFAAPLIGVTGTNGKTSITQFITQLDNYACIGTMGYGDSRHLHELSHTTPDALLLQKILAELSRDYRGVAMEVSSHALCLNRVDAVDIGVAVFSNLSQDHLDFHTDMEDYFQAKAKLFEKASVTVAIINTDDDYGLRLAEQCRAAGKRVITYGQQARCRDFAEWVHIGNLQLSQRGIASELQLGLKSAQGEHTLLAPVWGAFNAYNLLAALLALYAGGGDFVELLAQAQRLKGVKGRMESIDLGNGKTAIIDYAHTPDALKNTLQSLREQMREHADSHGINAGKIYTVFGCGGDRDRKKRPLMAEAVNRYSDFGIITDDNPRTEDRQGIFDDIFAGDIERMRFQVIPSRREAIAFGLSRLSTNDSLLIAGKGHEDYQIIGTEKTHFSDHEVVHDWLAEQTSEAGHD